MVDIRRFGSRQREGNTKYYQQLRGQWAELANSMLGEEAYLSNIRHISGKRISVLFDLCSSYYFAQVRALVLVLQAHMQRKDIVRAAMRSAANLVCVRPVVSERRIWY